MRLFGTAWLGVRLWVGRGLKAAGLPGVVVASTHNWPPVDAFVRVYVGPLFTVISVNGLDVHFHRLTGKED